MPKSAVKHLLIDTSCLRQAGDTFQHPDFQKLLRWANETKDPDRLKIYVPHIVWEERRTQLLRDILAHRRAAVLALSALKRQLDHSILLQGLAPPSLTLWEIAELGSHSRRAMAKFAADNQIEVIAIAPDHAERAWTRYFNVDPPFNPELEREKNRTHIPDSWIFEAAIDLQRMHPSLCAACGDGGLRKALQATGMRTFETFQEVVEEIEREQRPERVTGEIRAQQEEAAPPEGKEEARAGLQMRLAQLHEQFALLDTKLLGYVSYLGGPSKRQLFDLIARVGITEEIARNAAERLAIAGVLQDTGNYYLVTDTDVGDEAASVVEDEIIRLLEGNGGI
jgi:hypothetical protein